MKKTRFQWRRFLALMLAVTMVMQNCMITSAGGMMEGPSIDEAQEELNRNRAAEEEAARQSEAAAKAAAESEAAAKAQSEAEAAAQSEAAAKAQSEAEAAAQSEAAAKAQSEAEAAAQSEAAAKAQSEAEAAAQSETETAAQPETEQQQTAATEAPAAPEIQPVQPEGPSAEEAAEPKKEEKKDEEKEAETRENTVTFDVAEGAKVLVDGEEIKDSQSKAKDGKIVFTVKADGGYELVKVLVDGVTEARKNDETPADNDYIIEGIQTDATVVSVQTKQKETEADSGYLGIELSLRTPEMEGDGSFSVSVSNADGIQVAHEIITVPANDEDLTETVVVGPLPFGSYTVTQASQEAYDVSYPAGQTAAIGEGNTTADGAAKVQIANQRRQTHDAIVLEQAWAEGTEPLENVEVDVLCDGAVYETLELNAGGDWKIDYAVERYDLEANSVHQYSIVERVPEGYVATYNPGSALNFVDGVANVTITTSAAMADEPMAIANDGIMPIRISGETTVEVGETITLTSNVSGGQNHEWTSSDSGKATVEGKKTQSWSSGTTYIGEVTGVAPGEVTITHTYKKYGQTYTETYTITVVASGSKYSGSGNATFYVRLDGMIPNEPAGNNESDYTAGVKVDNAYNRQDLVWQNGMRARYSARGIGQYLKATPNEQQLQGILNGRTITLADGTTEKIQNFTFEEYEIIWYVLKEQSPRNSDNPDTHVDGVIRKKTDDSVTLTYDMGRAQYFEVTNKPDPMSQQYKKNQQVTVSENMPQWPGHTFRGWATDPNGPVKYQPNDEFTITEDTILYAIWDEVTLSVTVTKEWEDVDDLNGIRPESVSVQLQQDGKPYSGAVELNEANGWTHAWTGLPETNEAGDVHHEYTVNEVSVPAGYTSVVKGSEEEGFTITNTLQVVDVTVKKTWNDADNQDGIRPGSVSIQLQQNGNDYRDAVELNAGNDWTYIWENLPEYVAGEEGTKAIYTVVEPTLPEGYESKVTGDAETGFTVTNTHDVPALTVEKTADKTSGAELNDVITYTITVTNSGNVTVSDITVTDPKTSLNQSAGTLAPGESTSITTTHTITEADILAGSFVNTATATGTDPNGDEVTGSDDETVTTVKQAPALTVVKTANKTEGAALGEEITYTITVTNSGNVTVSDITVTDPKTGLNQNVGTLAPGVSTSVTTTHTITEADILAGSFVNTATATGTDPNGGEVTSGDDETVTTVAQAPALTVEKTANKTSGAVLGEEITYTITVTNSGNVTVKDITVTDPKTGLNQSVGTLAPGESTSVTTTHTITEADILAGSFVNTATATGTNPNGGEVSDSDDETVTTVEQAPALTIEKTANKTSGAMLGEEITYTITVTNSGNVTVNDITVTDSKTGLEESVGTLAPNASTSVTTTHTITEADILAGSFVNTATATGTDPKGVGVTGSDNETVTTVAQNPALTVEKTANKTSGAALGEEISYTITVTNSGNVTVSDITVTDPKTGLEKSVGTLAPGENASVTTKHTITEDDILAGSFVNTATATGTDPNGEDVTGSDNETVTTVAQAPALTVVKTADKTSGAALGEEITYTITVTNSGNVTVSDITVTDPLTGLNQNVDTLAPGEEASVTTKHTITEEDILAGSFVNIATATGTDPNGDGVTGSDNETVKPAAQAPALAVVKTADKTSGAELNDVITYTITITNNGNVTVSDITVTDPLTGLEKSVGALAPGASAEAITTTYTVQEKDILAGKIENTATATGNDPNNNEVTDSDDETVTTVAQNPALTVKKTANKTSGAALGEEITYTITVTNSGNVTMKDITVTDPLTGLNQSVGTLAPGASAEVITTTYTVQEKDILAGKVENTATATGTDPNGGEVTDSDDETVTTAAQNPALTVEKAANKTSGAALGEEITYTITVTNSGNVTVSDITVTDPLTGLEESVGTLAPGEKASVTTKHTITEADILAGSFENTATATGSDPNGGEVTGSDDETVTTVQVAPALTVVKTADKTSGVALGEEISYTITVTNSGNVTVSDITVTDPLTGLNQSAGTLAPGESASVTTKHTITEADILAGSFVNTATATGTDPNGGEVTGSDDETVTTAAQAPALTVVKTANKTEDAKLGEEITYTITVTNSGNVTVSDITVTDPLTGLNQSVGTLAPGESASVTTKHTITEADILAGSFVNTATATGTDPNGGEVTGSDDETVTTVEQAPALTVEKKADKTEGAKLGEEITYTITVTNSGNVTVSDITVTDPLTGLNQSVGTLAPGESASVTTKHTITEADILAGSFVNTATATGTDPNGGIVTGSDDETVTTVEQVPALTVEKTANKTEDAALGEEITYTITVTNSGNVTVSDITVSDPLTGLEQSVGTLAPGEAASVTTTHKITEADILAGSFENTATATGTDPNGDEVTGSGDETVKTEAQNPKLRVRKTIVGTSNNGFKLGDEITYHIVVENTGNVTLTNVVVTDELTGNTDEKAWTIDSLAPGESSETFTASHVVTEEDILAGKVVNTAVAEGTAPGDKKVTGRYSVQAIPVKPNGHLTITKTTTSTPENGAAYALGETITYSITATNDGNLTITDITVTDELTGDEWTIESLAPGASETFTASHVVTEADILAGSVVNVATAKGTSPDPDKPDVPVDPGEKDEPTQKPAPSLFVEKTAEQKEGGYKLGDIITFTIKVTNNGNVTVSDIMVTDPLTGLNQNVGTLEPNTSTSVTTTHTVTEADILNGKVVNTATATGIDPNGDEVTGSGDETVTTEAQNPKLRVWKTIAGGANYGYELGGEITYHIVVENTGNVTLTNVVVTDDLTGDEWTIESLAPGAKSEQYTATYKVTEEDILAGKVVNIATAAGTDPNGGKVTGQDDATAIPVDPNGHLTITKTTTSEPANGETYALGETITYSITATNEGNLTLTDVTVTDELTGDEWTIESLEPGASETFTASHVVTETDILAGSVVNVATATGTSPDPDEPEVPVEPGETEDPTDPKNGHLTITKETTSEPANGETYALGETITYSITATNEGNLTLTDVTVTDELTGDEWTIESLAPGANETFTAEYVVTEDDILAGSVVNEATATGSSPDPDEPEVPVEPGETEDPTDPKNGHLTITKETTSEPANGETYALGETITYSITAKNDGNLTLTDVVVTDELTGDEWTIESLEPGASEIFTAEYVVTEDDILAGSVVNEATATGTSPDPDEPEVPVDPGETEDPTDPKNGHVTITKTTTSTPANGETYALGETITYSITAENDGNLTLTNVVVTDALTGDEWTIESLEPGASETFTAEHVVTEADIMAGSVVNVATGKGVSPDPEEPDVPVDPGEKEDPTDPKNGHLTITKTTTSTPAEGEAYALGETITYEITATNDGNLTITDITVTDELTGDNWTIESLEPGASETFTAEYVVTEADILASTVVNVATATGTSPDPDEPEVPVEPGEKKDPTQTPAPSLFVEKTATSTPKNGTAYALGETVTYNVHVLNNGNVTISDITVSDPLTGDEWTIESLEPEASETFTAEHVVTEADILAGTVTNVATATGTDPNGGEVTGSDDEKVTTDPKNGHLTITKTTTSEPANGETYVLGETITYSIMAENDGNLTLTDVTVTDELTGDSWTIESLAPGASETFTAEHVVTEADILAGKVVNVATGKGTSPDPDEPEVPVGPGETEDPTDPKNGHLTITKTTTSTPENGETYVLGEMITYSITAENDGNLTLTNVAVTDELTGDEWTIESLEPGASETFTAEHVVTEADILAGKAVNVATATGTSPDPEEPDVPVDPGEKEDPTEPKDGHLTITKETTSTPENGTAYVLGETITYKITATNDGNLTLTDVVVTDELTGDEWTIESLAPEASETFTAEYVVTEKDILAGSVVNVATGKGTSPDPEEPDVPVEPGEKEDPTEPKDGHVTIAKETTSTPENGTAYALGETITYKITATNDGNLTLTDVVVTDELTGDEWTIESLEPGASETFTAEHVVTEADILAGSVVNVATGKGTSPDPEEPDVPVDPGTEEEPTDPKNGHLTITKEATSTPENGTAYALGETITYSITAKNDGNLTLTDVTVTDELTGDEWTIESLEPGASETFTAEHVVTEADILAGSVVNVATGTGSSPDPEEPDVPVEPGEKEDPTDPKNGHVTITKETTSTPENGTAYALGETITYKITATNDGNLTLTDVVVTDELTGDEWTIESLEPGASETFTAEHVVTEADILAGSVVNVATGTGSSPDPEEPDVPVEPGEKEDPTQTPAPSLFVEKTATSTPENGTAYALGETVTYNVHVLNNGNVTISDITVSDPLTGDTWTTMPQAEGEETEGEAISLAPGEMVDFTAQYVVTEADILAGTVTNVATAAGTEPNGTAVEGTDDVTVTTVPGSGHLTVVKTTTSTPANGASYALGETITYEITVTNDGNVTLTDVTLDDVLTRADGTQVQNVLPEDRRTIESIAPGATETITYDYVVTEADLGGTLVNAVTAGGTAPDPDIPVVPDDDDDTVVTDSSITVTKRIAGIAADSEFALADATFYVALFEDAAMTQRAGDVQMLHYANASRAEVTFTGLKPGTYYIAETNAQGVPTEGGEYHGGVYAPIYTNGQSITIGENGGNVQYMFENAFGIMPTQPYLPVDMTITKNVVDANGQAAASNETFYAGIFKDEAHTMPATESDGVYQSIVAIPMGGGASASVSVEIQIPETGEVRFYVAEVDANGTPVESITNFAYDVTISNATFTLGVNQPIPSVTITNTQKDNGSKKPGDEDETEKSEETTEVTTETETEKETSTDATLKAASVKTGDDTPILPLVMLLAVSALIVLLIAEKRRRDSRVQK